MATVYGTVCFELALDDDELTNADDAIEWASYNISMESDQGSNFEYWFNEVIIEED